MIDWGSQPTVARLVLGESLELLRSMPSDSVDLVMCSPPYEDARLYGSVNFRLKGEAWVRWAFERYMECVRVSRGMVCWVVEGRTKNFRYSATPLLLGADLHRAGVRLRKPPAYCRVGVPGSGGPDFLRNDYEFVLCSAKGRLPWSDPTAMGHPPKYKPGGRPSHHTRKGRVNRSREDGGVGGKVREYKPPTVANPGNLIRCHGGGGHLGSKLAHRHSAPYPESLAEAIVRSFCPPGGVVLDPFVGSGTTVAVAARWQRRGIGIDLDPESIELSCERLSGVCSVEVLR